MARLLLGDGDKRRILCQSTSAITITGVMPSTSDRDVDAFATLVPKNLNPPLSIGIFGEWAPAK